MTDDTSKANLVYCILCQQWKEPEETDRIVRGFDYIYCDACISDRTTLYAKYIRAMEHASDKEYRQLPHRRLADRERTTEWKQRNAKRAQHHSRMKNNRRRAKAEKILNDFSADDWERCLDYWGHKCAVCGRPVGLWHTLAMDHWIPLSSPNCPGTTATNIIPLCHGLDGCNNKKCKKLGAIFLIDILGEGKAKKKLREIEQYFEWVRQSFWSE